MLTSHKVANVNLEQQRRNGMKLVTGSCHLTRSFVVLLGDL